MVAQTACATHPRMMKRCRHRRHRLCAGAGPKPLADPSLSLAAFCCSLRTALSGRDSASDQPGVASGSHNCSLCLISKKIGGTRGSPNAQASGCHFLFGSLHCADQVGAGDGPSPLQLSHCVHFERHRQRAARTTPCPRPPQGCQGLPSLRSWQLRRSCLCPLHQSPVSCPRYSLTFVFPAMYLFAISSA